MNIASANNIMDNLIADGEDGAEVLLAANSKEQAKIALICVPSLVRDWIPKANI